jgi:hypothetical protein
MHMMDLAVNSYLRGNGSMRALPAPSWRPLRDTRLKAADPATRKRLASEVQLSDAAALTTTKNLPHQPNS